MWNVKRVVVGSALAVALAAAGCSRKSAPDMAVVEAHPAQSAPELQARLDAALKIPVVPARDATLQQVARDAAVSGQPDLCGASLSRITAPELRRGTADLCVAALAQAGNKAGADKLKSMPGVE